MPYNSYWTPNELFFTHRGIPIFHVYEDNEGPEYTYLYGTASDTSDEFADDDTVFDVRELATWIEPEHPPFIDSLKDDPETIRQKHISWDAFFQSGAILIAVRRAIEAAIEAGDLAAYITSAAERPKDLSSPSPEALPTAGSSTLSPICRNCLHWRDKAWTVKGWGICDNIRNDVKLIGLNRLDYLLDNPAELAEVKAELNNGIRYPEDFGCRFFDPLEGQ